MAGPRHVQIPRQPDCAPLLGVAGLARDEIGRARRDRDASRLNARADAARGLTQLRHQLGFSAGSGSGSGSTGWGSARHSSAAAPGA